MELKPTTLCTWTHDVLGRELGLCPTAKAAAVLFEEGTSQPQDFRQEDGVRVQGGSDAAEDLEEVRGEVGKCAEWTAEFGG